MQKFKLLKLRLMYTWERIRYKLHPTPSRMMRLISANMKMGYYLYLLKGGDTNGSSKNKSCSE